MPSLSRTHLCDPGAVSRGVTRISKVLPSWLREQHFGEQNFQNVPSDCGLRGRCENPAWEPRPSAAPSLCFCCTNAAEWVAIFSLKTCLMQISLVNMEFSLYKRAPVPPNPRPVPPLKFFAFTCAPLCHKLVPYTVARTDWLVLNLVKHPLLFSKKNLKKKKKLEAPACWFSSASEEYFCSSKIHWCFENEKILQSWQGLGSWGKDVGQGGGWLSALPCLVPHKGSSPPLSAVVMVGLTTLYSGAGF